MLKGKTSQSPPIFDHFRQQTPFHIGRGFLPLLAVMLLAAPQLAFANGPTVSVIPTSLDIPEGETRDYTIRLADTPQEAVMVTVLGAPENATPGSAAVSVSSTGVTATDRLLVITFAAGATDTALAATVTVHANADDDAANEFVTLTHTAVVGTRDAVTLANAEVAVRVTDDEDKRVIVTPKAVPLPVTEGSATPGTYTVALNSEPTGTVTVDVRGVSEEISVHPTRLVFTPEDYAAKTVSVYAGEDFDADHDDVTLTHAISGGDYSTEPVDDVVVRVTDNDEDARDITVSPGTLNIAAGTSRTFTIKLATQPKGTVKVLVAKDTASDNDQVTLSRPSVNFNSGNWNTPQTVTVRAGSNAATPEEGRDRSLSVTVNLIVDASVINRDVNYDSVATSASPDTVSVTISEALPSVSVTTSRSSLLVQEDSTGEYTVKLSRNPPSDIAIHLTPSVAGVLSGLPSAPLSFTANLGDGTQGTWNTWQTVMVTADRDADAEEEAVVLEHRWDSATGPVVKTVTVNVDELDTRGVTVSKTELEVREGQSNRYSLVLESAPVSGSVTVTIKSSSDDVTVNPSQLTFTARGAAQIVTVTALGDDDAEPNDPVTLSHTVRGSDYGDGNDVRVDPVKVTVSEKDDHGIVIDTTNMPDMEGESGTYAVELESQPTGTVTVQVRSDSSKLTLKPSQLKFSASDWNKEQTIRVRAEHDDDADDELVTLTHTASGGGYDGESLIERVSIEDDDKELKGLRTIPQALTLTEGGAASRYTMVLRTQPRGMVRVQSSVPAVGGVEVASRIKVVPSVLTFTQNSWNVPQMVTVNYPEDDIDHDNVPDAMVRHTASGGGYDMETADVTVTIRDNDTAALVVAPTSLEIVQDSHQEYTVALATEPTADVTVEITGGTADVTPTPTTLTFTSTDWASSKTVRVQVSSTATASATLSNGVTAGDSKYTTALSAGSVSVDVKSSDAAGVAVSPKTLEITEGESKSYTLVLAKKPTASVSIAISGAEGDISVSPRTVGFTTSNWNTSKTVRVTLAEDDDASDDQEVILKHAVTSRDTDYHEEPASNVRVTPKDNDQRGVAVTPTSLTIAAGSSGTYRVRLNTKPTADVRVVVNDPPTESVTVEGSPLIFTPTDWGTYQTVTVKVDAQAGAGDEQTVTLTHSVSGGDYPGEGAVPSVTVIIPVEGAPSAPRNLSTESGNQEVTLTWQAPANDGGSSITGYQVRYRQADTENYSSWRNVTGTSTTVTGLENGVTYEFQVRAVNSVAPGEPAEATESLAESAPGAPGNLQTSVGDRRITLSWSAPEDGGSQILRYEYRYRSSGGSWSDWMTTSGTSTTISDLTNGTEYQFQVRAVNSVGEGTAAEDSATPGRVPGAPTGLTARVKSETVTLMWGMPDDNGGAAITRYEVSYRMNGSGWSNWFTVAGGANANSYTMDGLTNGIGHEFQVRAVNAIGSGAAASVEATPMEGIDFAHFANGTAGGVTITSDIVLVNVETSAVTPAIYFYNQMGDMIDADSVVDATGDLMVNGDGVLTVPGGIAGQGEMTISTNGEGALVIGSVRVFGTGRLGGVLRFEIPAVGVAGVGASEPVSDMIFPARRMAGGIRTGAAVRNLSSDPLTVTCHLMQGGEVMDTKMIDLAGDGHYSKNIDEMFPGSNTTDFVGSVRCMASDGGMFTSVALEMDFVGQIFTTLPVVPLNTGSDSGESTLDFAHFANGDFAGTVTSSDLVFINVATSAVSPAVYFYDQMGNMIDASMVVDAMMDGVDVDEDGVLMVMEEIPPMGEMTISTSGMGDGMIGSVRVVSDGPIGGVLRFNTPNIGVAGVGASEAVNAAIFPARRMADGINTGAAIRNLMEEATSVTCLLRMGGQPMGEKVIELAGNGQSSEFINEMFPNADTDNFTGSVHCTAPSRSMFTGVALEMDFNNRIFTTLPVVPVQ